MKIKVFVLNSITIGKQCESVGHVCKEIGQLAKSNAKEDVIMVSQVSKKKISELLDNQARYNTTFVHRDNGFTEVEGGMVTAVGFILDD